MVLKILEKKLHKHDTEMVNNPKEVDNESMTHQRNDLD